MLRFAIACSAAFAVAAAALSSLAVALHAEEPPPGVTQLLPRNRIASIDDPVFVAADEADIPDDAWIMGVIIGGEARAYSLNILNRHEVVNDRAGEKSFAAVW